MSAVLFIPEGFFGLGDFPADPAAAGLLGGVPNQALQLTIGGFRAAVYLGAANDCLLEPGRPAQQKVLRNLYFSVTGTAPGPDVAGTFGAAPAQGLDLTVGGFLPAVYLAAGDACTFVTPNIACDFPPSGQVGIVYSHTFPASFGTPPYTFSISAGSLPPGLTLAAPTGVVSGTPTLAGLYAFTVEVTDSAAQVSSIGCSILITTISLICDNPPQGTVGFAYSHTFPASGGTPPYTFSISAGSLPPGLSLAAATGIVSGIPTLAGTFPFTVAVTDSTAASAQVDCSITIIGSGGNTSDGGGGGTGPSCRRRTPMLFSGSCVNPQRLSRYYRDFWGEYNPIAIARIDKLCHLDCFAPRFYHAPRNADEVMAAGAYRTYNLIIPPGSFIVYADSLTLTNMVLQITDVGLSHRWFSSPVPCELLQPSATTDGPRHHYLPEPYPVIDPGTFIFDIWNTSGSQQRCQITLGVIVPKGAC